MDDIESLIKIATESCSFDELRTSINEAQALEEGRRASTGKGDKLTVPQVRDLYRNWRYPILNIVLDQGLISRAGRKMLKHARSIRRDLDFIFAYLPSGDDRAVSYADVKSRPVDPITFFMFTERLFNMISALLPDMADERQALSTVVKRVLVSTREFTKMESLGELTTAVIGIVEEVDAKIVATLTPVLEQCAIGAVSRRRLPSDVVDRTGELVSRDYLMSTGQSGQIKEDYREFDSLVHFTTGIHAMLMSFETDWLYHGRATPDLVKESKRAVIVQTERLCAGAAGKACDGSLFMNIEVAWAKKFVGSRLVKTAYWQIDYVGTSFKMKVGDPQCDFVVPVFGKEKELRIRIMYEKKNLKKCPEPGTLCDKKILLSRAVSGPVITKFNRRQSAISGKCGTLTATFTYYPPGEAIPVFRQRFPCENIQLVNLLDQLVTGLVHTWITQQTLDFLPPCHNYLILVDFAVRYGIPATTLFLAIAEKMMKCWCHGETYLNAFTGVFLCAFMSMERCSKSLYEKKAMERVIEFLKERVPTFTMQHMSKPALYEKHALLSLFILSSFIIPEGRGETYVCHVVDQAVHNIVAGITNLLTPETGVKMIEDAEGLSLACKIRKEKRLSMLVTEAVSVSPLETQDAAPKRSAFVVYRMDTLSKTCEELADRSRQVHKFYMESCLPEFIDLWKRLKSEFCELGVLLIKNFKHVEKEATEQQLFKFIMNYKVVYKLLELPEDFSPYVICSPIILDWIARIGEKMIEWSQRAMKIDTFAIENVRDRTSSSLGQMMSVFARSLHFLHALKWEEGSLAEFLETYLSLCTSTLRFYSQELTTRMLSYFPDKIIQEVDKRTHTLYGYAADATKMDGSHVTPEAIFVTMNNMFTIRSRWTDFVDSVREKFPGFEIPDVFKNPVPNTLAVSKTVPHLFAALTAMQTTQTIAPNVWVKNSSRKMLMSNRASERVLNPLFTQRASRVYVDMFDTTADFIKTKIDALDTAICKPYYAMMLRGLLVGLDTGLMNSLMDKGDREPIKHKRLVPLVEFLSDIVRDVKTHAENCGSDLSGDVFSRSMPYTSFMIAHINDKPGDLTRSTLGDSDEMISLCIYLIVSSCDKDKNAVHWGREKSATYAGRRFSPVIK